jgi:hypothetical protein
MLRSRLANEAASTCMKVQLIRFCQTQLTLTCTPPHARHDAACYTASHRKPKHADVVTASGMLLGSRLHVSRRLPSSTNASLEPDTGFTATQCGAPKAHRKFYCGMLHADFKTNNRRIEFCWKSPLHVICGLARRPRNPSTPAPRLAGFRQTAKQTHPDRVSAVPHECRPCCQ